MPFLNNTIQYNTNLYSAISRERIGVIIAFFQSAGTQVTDSNWLNTRASGSAKQCFRRLKTVDVAHQGYP